MFEIHRLNFGSVRIDASMRVRGVAPGRLIDVPAQGFLVTGPGGPVLVDAGYRDPSVLGLGGTVGRVRASRSSSPPTAWRRGTSPAS